LLKIPRRTQENKICVDAINHFFGNGLDLPWVQINFFAMKDYKQFTSIVTAILILLVGGLLISTSGYYLALFLILIPVLMVYYAFVILRHKEDLPRTRESDDDWYDKNQD
jgi:glycerol-3-phosphate acyltransferase PlsY